MKFHRSPFWRMRGVCGTFLVVLEVVHDDGKTAELKVGWGFQKQHGWKILSTENIRIREREYSWWTPHQPKGEKIGYAI